MDSKQRVAKMIYDAIIFLDKIQWGHYKKWKEAQKRLQEKLSEVISQEKYEKATEISDNMQYLESIKSNTSEVNQWIEYIRSNKIAYYDIQGEIYVRFDPHSILKH